MIKVTKRDSIIDIIRKISKQQKKEIILDFPFWHPILHSITSLKILKSKSWKKELIIITNDKSAKAIGKKLWIKYSKIWETDLLEYNYSFIEYLKYILKNYSRELLNIFSKNNEDFSFEKTRKYYKQNPKLWIFFIWLLSSIFLLIFIFYFAVNKTYIYITPDIKIKTRAENFIFREADKNEAVNNNIIKLNKVSKLIYLTSTFWTSWINEDTLEKASWEVIMYNYFNEKIELLNNTRLQSEDWILYTSDNKIILPPAIVTSTWEIIPWETKINITSKIHDINWKIVWNKANIWTWNLLILPWLKENQDKIYAKTFSDISWANNSYTKKLTKQDIENAKELIKTKIKQKALNELKEEIEKENEKNNVVYEILWVDKIIEYSNFNIIWIEDLNIWENIDNFKLSATIKITSYTYNVQKVLNEMSSTIKNWVLEKIEKLLFINNSSLRVANILYKQEYPLEIKATAEVEAFYIHNFLNKQNTYIEKLKSSISWINKDDAVKILLNNSNISDVKIEIRPFFIKNISKINDNIIIKVIED